METTKKEWKHWFKPRDTFQTIDMISCILTSFMKKMQCNAIDITTVTKQVRFLLYSRNYAAG